MAAKETRKHRQGKILLSADDSISLEFSILSYVPPAADEHSINIAVLIAGAGFAEARFVPDWGTVLERDPKADCEFLTALAAEIRDKLQSPEERDRLLGTMQVSWSNTIRISPWKGCFTDNPEAEIETLVTQYLG